MPMCAGSGERVVPSPASYFTESQLLYSSFLLPFPGEDSRFAAGVRAFSHGRPCGGDLGTRGGVREMMPMRSSGVCARAEAEGSVWRNGGGAVMACGGAVAAGCA